MHAALILSREVGKSAACKAFNIPRATFYRFFEEKEKIKKEVTPPLKLDTHERDEVLKNLFSSRFCDKSPYDIYATLLDEGIYLCSIKTMYRILKNKHGSVKDRRRQTKRTKYEKPELLATDPNQVWSWDITKLKSHKKWTYYYLYVIIDIFSRYVVGWMVAHREQTALAKKLIQETCEKQNIKENQLTIHADRGSSMKSKGVAQLLVDLGIIKTHNRPYVSNDNPFSEAQFKTLKYHPEFPKNFGCIEDSRNFCHPFFNWYNKEHYHTGIGLMIPEHVHYGQAQEIYDNRVKVLKAAYDNNPSRFKGKIPMPPDLPTEVWINKPKKESDHNRFENLPAGQNEVLTATAETKQ